MTQKNTTQINLDQLIDVLQGLGIEVRSPHEQMLAEEQALGNQSNDANIQPTVVQEVVETPVNEAADIVETPANEATAANESAVVSNESAATPNQDSVPNENNVARASTRAPDLTRKMVIQALRALGADLSDFDPPAPTGPTTTGGGNTMGASAGGGGDGGVAVATSGVHVAAPQSVIKTTGVTTTKAEPAVVSAAINASGFLCGSCNEWNLRPTATHYYVVTVGREVGIFDDWHVVAPLVTGVSGAVFKRYSSLEVAEAVWNEAVSEGRVRRV